MPNRALSSVEQILRYAIDDQDYGDTIQIADGFAIDTESFYSHLYVARPEIESRIRDTIENHPQQVVVIGPAGCGKTSVLLAAARRYTRDTRMPHLCVDLKRLTIHSEVPTVSDRVHTWLTKTICAGILNISKRHGINDAHCLAIVVAHSHDLSTFNEQTEKVANEIWARFRWEQPHGTLEPISIQRWCVERFEARDPRFLDWWERLHASMDLYSWAYAIQQSLTTHASGRILVLLDNIDSIDSDQDRRELYAAVRSIQPRYTRSLRFIISSRPENFPFDDGMSDREAYFPIEVNLNDRIDWSDDPIDDPKVIDVSAKDLGSRIVVARVTYFEQKMRSRESSEGIMSLHHQRMAKWIQVLEHNPRLDHIGRQLRWLANWNHRTRALFLANFARFMAQLGPPDDKRFENNPSTLASAVTSLFYTWSAMALRGHHNWHYGFHRALHEWESGAERLGCLLDHLVLVVLRREGGHALGRYRFSRGIPFERLYAPFKKIGVSADDVAQSVADLFASGGFGRLADIDLQGDDRSEIRLAIEDQSRGGRSSERLTKAQSDKVQACNAIRINPRGCALLEHLATRFFFFATLVEIEDGTHRIPGLDHLRVTTERFQRLIRDLKGLSRMMITGLTTIKSKLNRPDWFEHYRRTFTWPDRATHDREGTGLLLDNLLSVSLDFWSVHERRSDTAVYGPGLSASIKRELITILTEFRRQVAVLAKQSSRLEGEKEHEQSEE